MKRLLGPVGGPVVFVLVAALAFAGLGWVTVVALRVERAQRETAAQAELASNLRVAMRQLDNRMLPALSGEDNRPFHHYACPDPLTGTTAGPTPLLAAQLPDYMRLHVQLDPATGWESPQVLAPEAAARVKEAWPELEQRNNGLDRATALSCVRSKFPPAATCEVLAARESAIPAGAAPLAVPFFTNEVPAAQVSAAPSSPPKPPPPPEIGPVAAGSIKLFGWEFKGRDATADNTRANEKAAETKDNPPAPGLPNAPVAQSPAATPGGRGGFSQLPDNDRGRNDYNSRAQTMQRAVQEGKAAALDPMYGKNYQANPAQNFDGKGFNNFNNALPPGPTLGAVGPGGALAVPPGLGGGPGSPPKQDNKEKAGDEKKVQSESAKAAKDLDAVQKPNRGKSGGTLSERLAALVAAAGATCEPPTDLRKRPVPPAEDRPAQGNVLGNSIGNTALPLLAGPPTVNIHLGSMRPQWITAPDGSEMLVLVRVAKIDARTVYQGVVLDWAKLQAVLKGEVADLFPDAVLLPVKDPADVSPDRAMTALPVQLDPGPVAPLPPAGWTPLRFGLLLAWAAALVACAAVGLSGWSLIDLAERRIRFVSAVTHELRTPLTSLRLYLDLLTSGMIHDEEKKREYLTTLATESDRLHRLIDNVLDFAKLEKRRANGDLKPIKAADLLDQLRQTWTDRVAADGKELVVVSTLPAELDVCTDAAMVHQIVGNLIDNARKYTRDAADRRIWLWARPDGANRVVFEVEDRGAGVPAGERKAIFKPFRRGATAETIGGAGLGLALAKQWAEVLGGTVAYRPADGAPGACFRLELPVPASRG